MQIWDCFCALFGSLIRRLVKELYGWKMRPVNDYIDSKKQGIVSGRCLLFEAVKWHYRVIFILHSRSFIPMNLINGTPDPEDEKLYKKYFIISETPVRGMTYSFKEEAIRNVEKNYGYFALMSNGIKDPVVALMIYRAKDLIEKSFSNLKERLNMRRMAVASEDNFEGKLFVQFVALELLSYIKNRWTTKGCSGTIQCSRCWMNLI